MPNSKDYMEMDDKYCAHNYHPIEVVISRAEGVWVYDPEGKKYLDCLSAYSSQNHQVYNGHYFEFGGAQIIYKLEDGYLAASDTRKDGQAVGY